MPRNCMCAGGCCGPESDGVSRRGFLSILGVGAATVAASGPAWAEWVRNQVPPEELAKWKKSLTQPAAARVYRSGVHKDARMHLGGIGTGNFEIGCDGRFTTWQLFNTLRDGQVPLVFAIRAGGKVKLLQTADGPDWPRVKSIEMTGEYPVAMLRYEDDELPVKVELSAFTPFAPLDSRFSSQPLASLIFRLHNPTSERQSVSLAALMQNPVGYDATGAIDGINHPKFGGNVNEPIREGGSAGLLMRAEPGRAAALDKPVAVQVGMNLYALSAISSEWPRDFSVTAMRDDHVPAPPADGRARTVVWFEMPAANLAERTLDEARRAVEAGATLVFSGKTMPLLETYALHRHRTPKDGTPSRSNIVFEGFEHGYDNWKVEGESLGARPASGTLPDQQPVAGFRGQGFVNSYAGGDATIGRLVSKPFTIERDYIRFLIGGGSHPSTQIRLMIGDRCVRESSGRNDERLLPDAWDVREFAGKRARLEIVDEEQGPWGHINIDQIEFSDDLYSPEAIALLDEMLPARFDGFLATLPGEQSGEPDKLVFKNLKLQPGARQTTFDGGLVVLSKPLGKGQVVVVAGTLLDPGRVDRFDLRQRAYVALCGLAGATYTPAEGVPPKACGFGTLALVAVGDSLSVLPAFDDWNAAREPLEAEGRLLPVDQAKANAPTPMGRTTNGAVAATVEIPPGGNVEVPFLLAWHYPNKYNEANVWMGCHYATLWPDARAVVREAAANLPTLRRRTEAFRKTFYQSTLPYWLLDCLTSQAATIRHVGVVFRIANGDVFGWEGSNGCCQPTCTHVWGYEQSLARLFPDLERIMRRIDFKHQQRADGGINNRTDVPSPPHPTGEGTAIDGHASCILKAYREALNHPDDSFLKEYWPFVKRAVEYMIARDAATSDGKPDGTLEDDQYNTYDQNLHGVTTFISAYYLAALRAGEQWARRMGDAATADRYHAIFEKGRERLVKLCWNGEYFQQYLADYADPKYGGRTGFGAAVGEVGPGCMSDQLIGQWWAHQLGLGYVLPKDKVQTALKSVFKYNWVPDLTGFPFTPRAFAGEKDKGLLTCTWPKGGRPSSVMLYSDEVWTGIEYQVAGHMLYEGMVEEAYAIVKGARDRYDGVPRRPIPRNPWNELECGGHYARAMANWSLLLAASGYEYDAISHDLRFTPRVTPAAFQSFFCGPEGWGSLRQVRTGGSQQNHVEVVEGKLVVKRFRLTPSGGVKKVEVKLGGKPVEATLASTDDGVLVTLAESVVIQPAQPIVITVSP